MELDLRQLDYVVALARHGNFTRVAEDLHVAQPAVSQSIRNIERRIGLDVFDRKARRMTAAGEILASRASRARAELNAAEEELQRLLGLRGGRIRIGAIHWVEPFDLPNALAEFHRRHPDVDLTLHEDNATVMLDRLCDGDLDLVIHNVGVGTERAGTARRVLAREAVVVAVSSDDPWATRRQLSLSDVAERRVITFRTGSAFRTVVDDAFRSQGPELQVALESSDLLVLRSLVAAGLGPAIVPRSVAEAPGPPVVIIDLAPTIEREVVLAWRTDRTPPPAVEELTALLNELSPAEA